MRRKREKRSPLRTVLPERRGRAEVGERRTMMRIRRVVGALSQQLHSLASCLLLRFSSARRSIPLRVHRIRPHRQTLLPAPPLHRIPTIRRPRAEAPASEAGEGEEAEEEEAQAEEEHHRLLLRTRIREESIQSYFVLYCTPSWGRHLCRLS